MPSLPFNCFCSRRGRKAIEKMLQFYDAYLSKCCLRPLYDEYGNLYIAVDMELKGRIREAMIKKMRAFEVNIK